MVKSLDPAKQHLWETSSSFVLTYGYVDFYFDRESWRYSGWGYNVRGVYVAVERMTQQTRSGG